MKKAKKIISFICFVSVLFTGCAEKKIQGKNYFSLWNEDGVVNHH